MKDGRIERILVETLNGLGECFLNEKGKGELAYLALTSKPEFAIRDRLAFELHKQLFPEYIVAREWKRIDMAILRNEDQPEPVAEVVVQLKTWSLFTFIDDADDHFKSVGRRAMGAQRMLYFVLLT